MREKTSHIVWLPVTHLNVLLYILFVYCSSEVVTHHCLQFLGHLAKRIVSGGIGIVWRLRHVKQITDLPLDKKDLLLHRSEWQLQWNDNCNGMTTAMEWQLQWNDNCNGMTTAMEWQLQWNDNCNGIFTIYCRAQWLRGTASGSQLREPGLESWAAVWNLWQFFSLYIAPVQSAIWMNTWL